MSTRVKIAAEVAAMLDDEALVLVTGRAARGEGTCQICGGRLDNGGDVAVGALATHDGNRVCIVLTHEDCGGSALVRVGAGLPELNEVALQRTKWTTLERDRPPRAGLLWEPDTQLRVDGEDAMLTHLLANGWARPAGSLLDTKGPDPAGLIVRLADGALRLTGAGLIDEEFDVDDNASLQPWLAAARHEERVLVLYGTGLGLSQRSLETVDWAIRMRRCAVAVARLTRGR
jgi:hypothetical protein